MPRDGLQQYAPPPGTQGVANYTIESARYNTFVADITADQNNPRPIIAGGTGGTNAIQARDNLDAAVAGQVVTNYDTHVFENGTFTSAPGATNEPVPGKFFSGVCHKMSDAAMYLEGRPENSVAPAGFVAPTYVRAKWSTWGVWTKQATGFAAGAAEGIAGIPADMFFGTTTAPAAAFIVNTESDITGINALTVTKAGRTTFRAVSGDAVAQLNALPGFVAQLEGAKNGVTRWVMRLGDAAAETGGNTGSDFWLYGVSDDGASVPASGITITRKTGAIDLIGPTTVQGTLAASGNITAANGTCLFSSGGGAYLQYTGGAYNLVGGQLTCSGAVNATVFNASAANICSGSGGGDGAYYFGNTFTKYLAYTGATSTYTFVGGNVNFGTPHASVAAPVSAGTAASGVWPMGISGTDRGILQLNSNGGGYYAFYCQGSTGNNVGSITGTTTSVAFNTASSAELKEDLKSFDAGAIIDATKVYDFAWKSTKERAYGVIAQQAIEVYPLAVTHMEKVSDEIGEYWGVDYSKYVPVLLQELKALRTRVAELEGRLASKPAR